VERVLVAYGSAQQSAGEIADAIGLALRARGHAADVCHVDSVHDVFDFDAVVLGSAVHRGRWHRSARRFARRFAGDLMAIPVWLFSTGPLDRAAAFPTAAPVRTAAGAADRLDGRGHMTLAGEGAVDRATRWADDLAIELSTPAIHLLAI
jgi:menaquinone-dependent protoporphyrinogen oxidase